MATVYRPEVDGLRSIAVSVVILYHAGFGWFSGGYVGVDVFFVISGYLITSILVADLERGRFSFRTFYERRARRIFPALFFVMACSLPFALLWLTPGQLKEYAQSLVAVTLFLSNLYFWLKSGYFGQAAESIPMIHTWSLSVEEQFYVVYPVVLLLVWHFARRWRTPVLLVAALASLAGCLWLERHDPGLNFFFSPTRAWELLAGAFVVLHGRQFTAGALGRPPLRQAFATLGLALVMVPVFAYDRHTPFPGAMALAPVAGTALLLCHGTPETWVGRLLATRPMVAIGLASYSAYLWHQPVFAFARNISVGHPPPLVFAGLIAAVAVLSALSLKYVEAPFRRAGQFSRQRIFGLSLAASLVFIAAGAVGHLKQGFPQRFDEATNTLARTTAPSPKRETCHTEGEKYRAPADACRYLAAPATWAVLGDSHGVEIAYALAERLQPHGQGVLHLTFSGCPPALRFAHPGPGCARWTAEALAFLEQASEIRHVVVAYRHAFHLYGEQAQTFPAAPDERPRFLTRGTPEAARAAYWANLLEVVQRLAKAGKTVHLLDPVPELGAPIDRSLYKRDLLGRASVVDAGAPLDYQARRMGPVLAELARPEFAAAAQRVRTADAVCSPTACRAILDGQALYFDDNHLSLAGARRVIDLIAAPGLAPPAPPRPAAVAASAAPN